MPPPSIDIFVMPQVQNNANRLLAPLKLRHYGAVIQICTFIYSFTYCATVLIGHISGLACPSVRPSVCHVWVSNWKTKMRGQIEISLNVSTGRNNRCAIFSSEGQSSRSPGDKNLPKWGTFGFNKWLNWGGILGHLRSPTSDFRPTSLYAEITWILCLLKCTIWLISTVPRVWQIYSLVVSNLGIPHLRLGNLTTGFNTACVNTNTVGWTSFIASAYSVTQRKSVLSVEVQNK